MQRFSLVRTTNGPEPLGMKVWVTALGKELQSFESLLKAKNR